MECFATVQAAMRASYSWSEMTVSMVDELRLASGFALPCGGCTSQVIQSEGTIYMVLEYGDIDLARLLAKHEQARREGGGADELDENFIRLYWQQMLQVCSFETICSRQNGGCQLRCHNHHYPCVSIPACHTLPSERKHYSLSAKMTAAAVNMRVDLLAQTILG